MRGLVFLALPLAAAACVTGGGNASSIQKTQASTAASPPSGAMRDVAPIPGGTVLDFAGLAGLLRERNPQLREAEAVVRAAEGRVRQAGLYPNPVLEAEVEEYDSRDSGWDGAETTLRLTQPILWLSKRGHAIEAARAEVVVKRRERDRLELQLLAELHAVYDDLLYLRQARALNGELADLTRQSLEIARTRFELQASPQSDVSRAEVEVFERELNRREIERDQAEAAAQLTELLGGTPIDPGQVQGIYVRAIDRFSTDALTTHVLAEHPDLKTARDEAKAARARFTRERSEWLPDLLISAGLGHNRAEDSNAAEAAIGIELPIFHRNQGEIDAAEADIEKAQSHVAAVEDRLRTELKQALSELEAARERRAYHAERVLPSAQRAHGQVSEGYHAGKLGFLELIDAQRTLTAARLQRLELVREIRRAETRLFAVTGSGFTLFEPDSSSPASEGATR